MRRLVVLAALLLAGGLVTAAPAHADALEFCYAAPTVTADDPAPTCFADAASLDAAEAATSLHRIASLWRHTYNLGGRYDLMNDRGCSTGLSFGYSLAGEWIDNVASSVDPVGGYGCSMELWDGHYAGQFMYCIDDCQSLGSMNDKTSSVTLYPKP